VGAFNGVSDAHEAARHSRDVAAHEDQVAVLVDAHNHEVLNSDAVASHAAGHLLPFENTAWVLALARATERAMGFRYPVRRPLTAEVMPFHSSLKAFPFGGAANIDELARDEVSSNNSGAHGQQGFRLHKGSQQFKGFGHELVRGGGSMET